MGVVPKIERNIPTNMINHNCPQPPSATISYIDGEEQILEFPVSPGNLKNLKVDGRKIMDIHDLALKIQIQTRQLSYLSFAIAVVGIFILVANIYHILP